MWKLQTNMPNADNIQDMARTNRKTTNKHNAHNNRQQSVWLQGRNIHDRCNHKSRTVRRTDRQQRKVQMGLSEASEAINRTRLWTTLYKKGLPEEMIRHIRRGHRWTKLSPKYRGSYGESKGNNVGVFQGSSISALLFIIYLVDMMEELAALNRRTSLPMRVIQDRPREQNKKLLWMDI